MSDHAGLRSELKQLIVKRLRLREVQPEAIEDDAPLLGGSLGLDSLDLLEVALAVEARYGLKISDEQLGREAFQSVANLASFVHQSLAGVTPDATREA